MSIWFRDTTPADINRMRTGTLVEHLGIEIIALGDDYIEGRMPVDRRTIQPAGILHGGASVALAETLGSIAGNLAVDASRQMCVGLEINANHLRAMREGYVIGRATPIHLGGTTQVWDIRIRDEQNRPVCVSRITLAVLERRKGEN